MAAELGGLRGGALAVDPPGPDAPGAGAEGTLDRQRPGRPRSSDLDRAIEAAAVELLVDEGFGRMSIEGVAARAGVGKASVYRRWDTKADLVVDAVIHRCQEHVVSPDTGSLHLDLLEMLRALRNKFVRDGEVMSAFTAEQGRHPDLAQAFRSAFLDDRRAAVRAVLERGVARGELSPEADLELLGDVGSAIMWHRFAVRGAALDDDLPERIVAQFFTAR